jgi:hypothetical protein
MLKTPIDPDSPCFQLPPPGLLVLPHLPIHGGLSCPACSYICTSKGTIEKHFRTQHTEHKRVKGRPFKAAAATAPQWHPVSCQRLFVRGSRSQFFAVISPTEAKENENINRRQRMAANLPETEYVRAQIDEALEQGNQERSVLEDRILDNAALTEVSPWLEMTRWPKYLQDHSPMVAPWLHAAFPSPRTQRPSTRLNGACELPLLREDLRRGCIIVCWRNKRFEGVRRWRGE